VEQRLIGFGDVMINAIMVGPGAIDTDEAHRRVGGQQYMVPGTEAVIDALLAVGDESAHLGEIGIDSRRADDNDEWARVQWQKGLAAKRMVLEVVDLAWHVELTACHQADDGT
jgi:hypothetical protein